MCTVHCPLDEFMGGASITKPIHLENSIILRAKKNELRFLLTQTALNLRDIN